MKERHVRDLGLNCTAGVSLALLLSGPAWAQAATPHSEPEGPSSVDDIIVTAQRYSERSQDVPISITAIGGEQLAQRGLTDIKALGGSVPSLYISGSAGINGTNVIAIRGLSGQPLPMGGSQATAIYLDGIYLPRPDAAFFALDDVERIEVLRGPQGTLYGRNATAGAINIITKTPGDTVEGGADISLGNYDAVLAKASVLFPIGAGFSGGVSGSLSRHDGYFVNTVTGNRVEGNDAYTARAKLRYESADGAFTAMLTADTSETDGGIFYDNVAATPLGDPYEISSDALSESRTRVLVKSGGVAALLTWYISDNLELSYISGYREFSNASTYDLDASATGTFYPPFGLPPARFNILTSSLNKSEAFSNELRLNYAGEAFRATIGVNTYNDEQSLGFVPTLPTVQLPLADPRDDSELFAAAVFGQVEWTFADRLTLVGGLRFNHEERDFTIDYRGGTPAGNLISGDISDDVLLPAAGLNFQATPDVLLYAKYSQGYQSPGFNSAPARTATVPTVFGSERLDAYEIGVKSQFLDRRITFNAAAFHYDYADIQVRSTVGPGLIAVFNAAGGEIDGAEATLSASLPFGFTLSGNLTYLDATYTEFCESSLTGNPRNGAAICTTGTAGPNDGFDRAGNRLNQSPEWQSGIALAYLRPVAGMGDLRINVSYNAVSNVYYTTANEPLMSSGDIRRLDARLGLALDNGAELYVFGKNLTDDYYVDLAVRANAFLAPVHVSEPRTYGVGVRYRF